MPTPVDCEPNSVSPMHPYPALPAVPNEASATASSSAAAISAAASAADTSTTSQAAAATTTTAKATAQPIPIPLSTAFYQKVDKTALKQQQQTTDEQRFIKPPKKRKKQQRQSRKRSKAASHRNDERNAALPMTHRQAQVRLAASLVMAELQSGAWPEATEGAHARAAVALERFALEIFLPYLFASSSDHDRSSSSCPSDGSCSQRPFLAALMALREVMMQNAQRIFATLDEKEDNNNDAQVVAKEEEVVKEENSRNEQRPAGRRRQRRRQQSREQEQCFAAKVWATGIILAAASRLEEPDAVATYDTSTRLKQLVEAYDSGDAEFSSCLQPADARAQGIVPNGCVFGPEQNLAWKVSYNLARNKHPLMVRQYKQRESRSREVLPHAAAEFSLDTLEMPTPTACFMSMVEHLPNC